MVEYLVVDDLDHVERGLRGNGVDDHVSMNADEVFAVEETILILVNPSAQGCKDGQRYPREKSTEMAHGNVTECHGNIEQG